MRKNVIIIVAIALCSILFGHAYCYMELNGTISGVKTILRAILFECSNDYNEKSKGGNHCVSYLAISIKTDPSLHINKLHQFLLLDEIYVANRFSIAKLLAPLVIEIIRGEPLTMCPIEYDQSATTKEFENDPVNRNRYTNSKHQENNQFFFDEENNKNKFISKSLMQATVEGTASSGKRRRRYTVFNTNMPIAFLMTTVKIFQKRSSTWWKLAPSVTVNSYSEFDANGQLSVWFKYHINIFQLSKSINQLKNSKLLMPIPKKSEKLDNIVEQENVLKENDYKSNYLNPLENPLKVSRSAQSSNIKATTFLENCAYNSSILCINLLDDVVAGYSLKIRLPFLENAFIKPNVFKVKIITVITDATVKDTAKISITLVNEGFEVYDFAVNVDCLEQQIGIKQTYSTKKLLPHVGETMDFLLPFIFKSGNQASKKSYCKIWVKTLPTNSTKRDLNQQRFAHTDAQSLKKQRTVTTRKITIVPHQRCLCVWKCSCHCLAKLETNVDFNICQELDASSQSKAGLLTNSNYYGLNENDSEDSDYHIRSFLFDCFCFAIVIFLLMGFLGFCKATIGTCIPFVDNWGYDYLQPGRKYVDASKCRHFFINLFYFILLPFLICCNCFTPSAEDLLISNSENFMTKMYIYVYEVFYDSAPPTIIIIEETASSAQIDEY